jgi:hypothetical protein
MPVMSNCAGFVRHIFAGATGASKGDDMAQFLLAYHGGTPPQTEDEGAAVMQAWTAWFGTLGEALVDGGKPTGDKATVAVDGSSTSGGGANPINGYSIVSAATLDDALSIAKGCPHLDAGGTIEVGELLDM